MLYLLPTISSPFDTSRRVAGDTNERHRNHVTDDFLLLQDQTNTPSVREHDSTLYFRLCCHMMPPKRTIYSLTSLFPFYQRGRDLTERTSNQPSASYQTEILEMEIKPLLLSKIVSIVSNILRHIQTNINYPLFKLIYFPPLSYRLNSSVNWAFSS